MNSTKRVTEQPDASITKWFGPDWTPDGLILKCCPVAEYKHFLWVLLLVSIGGDAFQNDSRLLLADLAPCYWWNTIMWSVKMHLRGHEKTSFEHLSASAVHIRPRILTPIVNRARVSTKNNCETIIRSESHNETLMSATNHGVSLSIQCVRMWTWII